MRFRRGLALATVLVASASPLAGCGGDDKQIRDEKIVDELELERLDTGLAIQGDPFCTVKEELLNDSDEVADALDRDESGFVVASGEGNAGVEGVPPFSRECKHKAKKDLNRLDPRPPED